MKKNKKLPRRETSGELVINPKFKPEPNTYLLEISKKIKLVKILVILLTVVFLLGMILIFRNDITLENYRYLIRFFSSSGEYNGDYRTIYFDSASTTSIGIFNGDLATVSTGNINLYSMKGNNTLSEKIAYSNPVLNTQGKYMAVYDLGGNSFELLNNFSVLYSESYEYPISLAKVSDDGMFAVVTKSLDYQSVVNLYDHNFRLLSKIYKDKYVMDLDISSDASEILLVSAYSENGIYCSEVMVGEPYSSESKSSVILSGEFAVSCNYFGDGSYCVLTDKAIHFYSKNSSEAGSYLLGDIVPTKYFASEDYVVVAYNENIVGSDTGIIIFDKKGQTKATYSVPDKIFDIDTYRGDIYLLLTKNITRITSDGDDAKSYNLEGGGTGLFILDNDTVIVGYSNMIEAHSISKMFK